MGDHNINRVLIANRGEIAIRIARAAASLGLESVAVYPRIDAQALHPQIAADAVELSDADGISAYLDIDGLIAAARAKECDCIHPGYGFLSESAAFARACAENGIKFIGPTPQALELFGDKVRARSLAQSIGVPIVPGSNEPLDTPDEVVKIANETGYPIMLKAAAGGGGRGMRLVSDEKEVADAFERCRSEAVAAFGNGAVFIEKYISRPRHIEVQILSDQFGNHLHLLERDCSVQIRNQKVLEVAPAVNLDNDLKALLFHDAVRIAERAEYVNAGTVEFLVCPEANEYYFIECNPRIQVEHTITEEISGIDLVATQFAIAAGKSLNDLGLRQDAIEARGVSVQARVVVQGTGTITSYREPAGPGVRVDGCGYLGLTPPPEFDPLLAKVVCTARGAQAPANAQTARTLQAAIDKTLRALDELHIIGIQTNIQVLKKILQDPSVISGDARTTLLSEHAELMKGDTQISRAQALFSRQSAFLAGAKFANATPTPVATGGLSVSEGAVGAECPMSGTVVGLAVGEGALVAAGETLMVISAMKMETAVTSPCAGKVMALEALSEGDQVGAGQVVAVIQPSSSHTGQSTELTDENSWTATLREIETLRSLANKRLAEGSSDPGVIRQRSRGKLTCRERIDLLLDEGTFREVGSVAGFASYDEDGNIADFTPANHVGGSGKIDGRPAIVCADDFTSRGGHADGAIGAKSTHLDRLSVQLKIPSVRLLDGSSGGGSVAAMVPKQKADGESKAKESAGAIKAGRPRVAGTGGSFLPGHLGSTLYAEQLSTVPVVNVLLGGVVGIGAAKAVLGHFSVMVRDISQLFVAGPPVVSHAMGYDITKEELGGWHIHCQNGAVDNLVETEEEAFVQTKRFLSYLPSSVYEPPPIEAPDPSDVPDRREEELFTIIPRKRTTTFDIRRTISLMADKNSFFEIGPLWGTDQVTGFVRFNGYPLGVIASDSRHVNGGALTADGCDKLKRHLDLCDLFHIPVLNLVDNPGFAVGLEHELAATIRKGGEWMIAFAQINVPIFTVIMRRSFGVAGNNYATPQSRPSVRVVWPAADVGGIPPEGGIEAAYKRQLAEADDPIALRAELEARIESARGPLGPLSKFQMEEMIDPRDTRKYICDWAETAYRNVSQPGTLGPRALQFRP